MLLLLRSTPGKVKTERLCDFSDAFSKESPAGGAAAESLFSFEQLEWIVCSTDVCLCVNQVELDCFVRD